MAYIRKCLLGRCGQHISRDGDNKKRRDIGANHLRVMS